LPDLSDQIDDRQSADASAAVSGLFRDTRKIGQSVAGGRLSLVVQLASWHFIGWDMG